MLEFNYKELPQSLVAHPVIVKQPVLNDEGDYIKDNRGVSRKHPSAQIHKDNSMMALKYEEQFGLTPLSRGKVKGEAKQKEKDPLKDFQKRGGKIQAVK